MLSASSLVEGQDVYAGANREQYDTIQTLRRACRASFRSDPLGDLSIDQCQNEPSWNRTHPDQDSQKALKSDKTMPPLLQAKAVRAQGLDRMPTRIQLDISMDHA